MRNGLIGLLIVGSIASTAFAARPFSVEDSGVLEKGVELELGYAGNTAGDSRETEKSVVVNFSLIPEVLHIGYERAYLDVPRNPWGSADSAVSLKYNFLGNQAVKASVSMIDGDEINGFGNEYTEYGLTYSLDGEWGPAKVYSSLSYATYNSGDWYTYTTDAEGEEISPVVKNNFSLGLGLEYPLFENLSGCFELTKQIVQGNYLERHAGDIQGLLGVVWTVYNVPVDISYTTNPNSKDHTYAIGTTLAL